MSRLAGLAVGLTVGATVGLFYAGVASADKEKVDLTAAGRAAARAVVVKRADLGTSAQWKGGARKPVLAATMRCAGYQPRQSDLVLIGAAKTVWQSTGIQIESDAQVLRTPAMVQLDWQRTVLAPAVLPCVRSGLAKDLSASERLVSLQRIAFPHIATYTRAYRALIDVKTAGTTAHVMIDIALFGHGRTEITLTTTAPLVAAAAVKAAEIRLAGRLVARIKT